MDLWRTSCSHSPPFMFNLKNFLPIFCSCFIYLFFNPSSCSHKMLRLSGRQTGSAFQPKHPDIVEHKPLFYSSHEPFGICGVKVLSASFNHAQLPKNFLTLVVCIALQSAHVLIKYKSCPYMASKRPLYSLPRMPTMMNYLHKPYSCASCLIFTQETRQVVLYDQLSYSLIASYGIFHGYATFTGVFLMLIMT